MVDWGESLCTSENANYGIAKSYPVEKDLWDSLFWGFSVSPAATQLMTCCML